MNFYNNQEDGIEDLTENAQQIGPFTNSITQNQLRQTNQEIKADLKAGRNLEIQIDENADYQRQTELANQNLQDKLSQQEQDADANPEMEDDDEPLDPKYVLEEFKHLFYNDEQLRMLLGEGEYSIEEKESIIKAYKKGGGVAGLADIIDEDENEITPQNNNEEVEETEINLDDPDDVKIIEEEFKKLFDRDENFRKSFGDEAFGLSPIQKYQIIDAYDKGGMEAVIGLLSNSADQSDIMPQVDDSRVIHEGKVYNRIQIQDLGEDEEYLMDENGDIYTNDFVFIINMGDNVVVEE